MYFKAKVDKEKCNGCKICILFCPEPNTIKFDAAAKKIEIDENRCKACKICVVNCPKQAIELEEK